MRKYTVIIMAIIVMIGCGSKEGEPKPTASNESKVTDFVPEHVRLSTIEVVPHPPK